MKVSKPFTEPSFIPAVQPFKDGRLIQDNEIDSLFTAGVQNLRSRPDHLSITSYPTEPEDLQLLRAVHVAVRTGDFYRLSKLTDSVVFGLTLPTETHEWLKNSPPGKPEKDITNYLRYLAQRDKNANILEAQLDPSVAIQVFATHEPVQQSKLPTCLLDSERKQFKLEVGAAYLRPDDWQRIIEEKKPDNMRRAEGRDDLWKKWMAAVTQKLVGEVQSEKPDFM